jgi:hypothetical protein
MPYDWHELNVMWIQHRVKWGRLYDMAWSRLQWIYVGQSYHYSYLQVAFAYETVGFQIYGKSPSHEPQVYSIVMRGMELPYGAMGLMLCKPYQKSR